LDHAGDLSEPLVQDLLYGFMLLIILCEEADGVAVAPAADTPLPPPDLIQDPFKVLIDLDPHSELLDADIAVKIDGSPEINVMTSIFSTITVETQKPSDAPYERVAELHGSISLLFFEEFNVFVKLFHKNLIHNIEFKQLLLDHFSEGLR